MHCTTTCKNRLQLLAMWCKAQVHWQGVQNQKQTHLPIHISHRNRESSCTGKHSFWRRGHSNWPKASHNVLIRFRNQHIFLERLHYQLSTNLDLLHMIDVHAERKGPGLSLDPRPLWALETYGLQWSPGSTGEAPQREAERAQQEQKGDHQAQTD